QNREGHRKTSCPLRKGREILEPETRFFALTCIRDRSQGPMDESFGSAIPPLGMASYRQNSGASSARSNLRSFIYWADAARLFLRRLKKNSEKYCLKRRS